MEVGACASPVVGYRPLSSSGFATTPVTKVAVLRALKFSSVQSFQSEFQVVGKRAICGVKYVKGSRGVCAQLADSNQLVEDQSMAGAAKCVLVVGATGGVGQLVVAALLDRGIPVRAVLRDAEKARTLFGDLDAEKLQVHVGDTRQPESLSSSLFEGVTHVICCTGTTAFPSKRWDGDNGPEKTDWEGVRNLVAAVPKSVQHVVLVSSIGVTKSNELPWKTLFYGIVGGMEWFVHSQSNSFLTYRVLFNTKRLGLILLNIEDNFGIVGVMGGMCTSIMNLFGVLKYKKMGEDFLRDSGIPYTIIRPGRLTDGPYTSYDLNTLLKATAGTRRDVIIGQGDTLVGEASRVVVAESCIQALEIPCTIGQTYEVSSVEGEGPGKDQKRWEALFNRAHKA